MTSWHGGKGSKYRKVDQQKFNDNWDKIFGKKEDNTDTSKNEYQDILSTEDAIAEDEAFRKIAEFNSSILISLFSIFIVFNFF